MGEKKVGTTHHHWTIGSQYYLLLLRQLGYDWYESQSEYFFVSVPMFWYVPWSELSTLERSAARDNLDYTGSSWNILVLRYMKHFMIWTRMREKELGSLGGIVTLTCTYLLCVHIEMRILIVSLCTITHPHCVSIFFLHPFVNHISVQWMLLEWLLRRFIMLDCR